MMQRPGNNKFFKPLLAAAIALWFVAIVIPFTGYEKMRVLAPVFLVVAAVRVYHDFFSRSAAVSGRFRFLHVFSNNLHELYAKTYVRIIFTSIATILLLLFPVFGNNYQVDVAVMVGIYSILAIGLNVVVGWAGLLNLGYVAFYAIGAYSYALLNTSAGISFWVALPISMLLAGLSGFLLGLPVLRLRGDYLAIVTLGFGEMVRIILNNWDSFTHGPNGILNIARPNLFGFVLRKPMHYYYLTLVLLAATIFILHRLYISRSGGAWIALREDELAASAMGINTTAYKLLAFALGATWAGLAGTIFAAKMTFISPESFTFMESVTILCMVVLGGMGSIPGSLLGACILVILPEVMRDFSSYRMLIFGAALVIMMSSRPQGFLPPARRTSVPAEGINDASAS
jgi:branched-chain amino acid transport system permease protein